MTTSGHALRGHGAESKDAPSGGMLSYYTIDYCHVIQFFESLKKCFPLPPFPNFVSAVLCVVVFAASFLSALTLAGPEKYLILNVINFFMIAKLDLLKRLRAFVHSHLIPTLVCSVGAQQTSFGICSTYLYVVGKMGET